MLWPPFFSPLCLLFITYVTSRTCIATSFLLDSSSIYFTLACFCTATSASLVSIFTSPVVELILTPYDSLLLYFTQHLHILYHLLFFYLPLLSVLVRPFLFLSFTYQSSTHFSLRLIHPLLRLIHVLLVYSIAYVYLVWLGCRLVIYKGAMMSLEG